MRLLLLTAFLILAGCAEQATKPVTAPTTPPNAACHPLLPLSAMNEAMVGVTGLRHAFWTGGEAANIVNAFNALPPTSTLQADRVDLWITKDQAMIALSLKGCVVGREFAPSPEHREAILRFIAEALGRGA